MIDALLQIPIGGEGLWQEALNKGMTALVAGTIVWIARKKYYERVERGDKLDKTYKALFGVEDVDTMEGVVEIIEAHEDDIEEIYNKLEEGKKKRERMEERLNTVKEKIDSRKDRGEL